MEIYEPNYVYNAASLVRRKKTDTIILHHRAGDGTPESINTQHRSLGYTCIGYHFYVRKDGTIYRGRPVDTIGAHASGANDTSVGICFEGNFELEKMTDAQIISGRWLVAYVNAAYGGKCKVIKHSDVGQTACPGKNFPFDKITARMIYISEDQTVNNLISDGIITWDNAQNWEAFLSGAAPCPAEYIRAIFDRYHKRYHPI